MEEHNHYQMNENEFNFPTDKNNKIAEILCNKKLSRSKKQEELRDVLGITKGTEEDTILKAACGLKFELNRIFTETEFEDNDNKFEFSGYEIENFEKYQNILNDEDFQIFDAIRNVYDASLLANILKNYNFLSEALVDSYEKHKADLKVLKKVVIKYCPDEYDRFFRLEGSDEKAGTYTSYVNSNNSKNKKIHRSLKVRKYDELKKTIKKIVEKCDSADPDVVYIKNELDCETFLPKQRTSGNGTIPNQVHYKEMKQILINATNYLPFLNDVDESGLKVSDRILKLFSFHIPYYIGPVTERSAKNGGNGWVIRKVAGQVLPWNIKDKIDIDKTSEEFIKRLIRDCTYLTGKKVLPKGSLLYQKYMVLNEINNIKINDKRIEPKIKQELYNEIFLKHTRVTRKKIVEYLANNGYINSEDEISGIDKSINTSLTSYHKFYAVFGEKLKQDKYRDMTEQLVSLLTIYGDARNVLKERLDKEFPELTPEEKKGILRIHVKDWGRLSKEILSLEGYDAETGEVITLIEAMWRTSFNFMELINMEGFKEALQNQSKIAQKIITEFKVEDLNEFYFSAPVKRMIWQTILIIKELRQVLKADPQRVFIEVTRTNKEEKGDKGRKESRKKELEDIFKRNHDQEMLKLLADKEEDDLRQRKMYLYFKQLGRCMYTGDPIDLDRFGDYDLDHIFPKHFIKDDSIHNNLVLVSKHSNAYKSDTYPIPLETTPKIRELWKTLHTQKLINDEKYKRLTRRDPFTQGELARFIDRQLVETNQGTKGVAEILKGFFPKSEIVYSKAENVSDFRNEYKLIKSRLVNDFHHAQDAYLNIVVGNAYHTKFTRNRYNFIKSGEKYHLKIDRLFANDIIRDNIVAWKKDKTLDTVKKVMAKTSPLMTRLSYEQKGELYNATLYPANKAKKDSYIPFKETDNKIKDVTKYGGFGSISSAYFFLVEHGTIKRELEIRDVPIYLKTRIEKDKDALLTYCKNILHLNNPKICLPKIKLKSLFKIDDYPIYLSAKSNKQLLLMNAKNLKISLDWISYIRKLENYGEKGYLEKEISDVKNLELYDELLKRHTVGCYSKRPNPVGDKLRSGKEKFKTLSLDKQVKVLVQILGLSQIGLTSADLQDIGGAGKAGVMMCSMNITGKDIKLVNQSPTGLYEQEIDLNKL